MTLTVWWSIEYLLAKPLVETPCAYPFADNLKGWGQTALDLQLKERRAIFLSRMHISLSELPGRIFLFQFNNL